MEDATKGVVRHGGADRVVRHGGADRAVRHSGADRVARQGEVMKRATGKGVHTMTRGKRRWAALCHNDTQNGVLAVVQGLRVATLCCMVT